MVMREHPQYVILTGDTAAGILTRKTGEDSAADAGSPAFRIDECQLHDATIPVNTPVRIDIFGITVR